MSKSLATRERGENALEANKSSANRLFLFICYRVILSFITVLFNSMAIIAIFWPFTSQKTSFSPQFYAKLLPLPAEMFKFYLNSFKLVT